MNVGQVTSPTSVPRLDQEGEARAAALAEKRRAASAQQSARADADRVRHAEQLAELREAVSRALGANTRLSIERREDLGFVYRAIDKATGEIVHEWPEETFLALVRGVREDVRTDVDAGLMLDDVA